MNREDFKKLDILSQINYVNKILKKGKTVTDFSKDIGISRKIISKNFSESGYKFNQSQKQYILQSVDLEKEETEKSYCNTTESNSYNNASESDNIPIIQNITTNLEISNNQKNSLMYLVENIDRIKAILDSPNEHYKDNNIEKKEDIVKDIYKFKQAKKDYRVKTLKLDIDIQKGFEIIAEELKDKGITQQELLNYILSQYIKFYEEIK